MLQSDKWRHCIRMGYNNASFENHAKSRETAQYVNGFFYFY